MCKAAGREESSPPSAAFCYAMVRTAVIPVFLLPSRSLNQSQG